MKPILFSLENIFLQISSVDKPILSDISCQIHQGDFIVLLGSNGSGKSSLLKLFDSRYQQTSGKITFNGKNLTSYSTKSLSREIKSLTQNCNESLFTSLTIFENYLLIKQQYQPNLFSLTEKYDRDFLADYVQPYNPNLSSKLNQAVDKLSGGEKQTLALALMLLYPPQCLLLDEHTSALDPKTSEQLMTLTSAMIAKHQVTCILTTHDLEIANQYGNRIIALRHGKMHQNIDTSDKHLLTQQYLLAACY